MHDLLELRPPQGGTPTLILLPFVSDAFFKTDAILRPRNTEHGLDFNGF
jgi:hypothetical protein